MWKPIETAPKDRPILGVVDGRVRVIQYGKTSHVPLYGWCLADQGWEDFDLCEPTHWLPFPTPPAVAKPETERKCKACGLTMHVSAFRGGRRTCKDCQNDARKLKAIYANTDAS